MKAIYPCKVMNITQSWKGNFSHKPNREGNPNDFPIDEACSDRGRDYFFAPCDLKIVRIYGVGSSGANTIWMQSTKAVETSIGNEIITIMVVHPEDDDLKKIKVGQIFKQGDQMFREGMDGRATGNHFHMSISTGVMRGVGWIKNDKDAWVIYTKGIPLKPEQVLYLTDEIKVISTGGLNFNRVQNEEEVDEVRYNKLSQMPSWAQPTIKKLMDKGIVKGDLKGNLDLSEDMVRLLVMNDRAGLY